LKSALDARAETGGTVRSLLREGLRALERAGLPTARQDAEWLLAELLGVARSTLYLEPDRPVPAALADRYTQLLARRLRGEPVQHLLGWEEFCGLRLRVTPEALIPRPETELLVEWAVEVLRAAERPFPLVIDLGTGSGAIACALAHSLADVSVVGIDVSGAALAVAAANVRAAGLETRVRLVQGDLLASLGRVQADLAIANPPYLVTGEIRQLPVEVRDHEPRLALDGGPDGMAFHRRILAESPAHLRAGGWLLMEVGERQAATLAPMLAAGAFEAVEVRRDLRGMERMIGARRR